MKKAASLWNPASVLTVVMFGTGLYMNDTGT